MKSPELSVVVLTRPDSANLKKLTEFLSDFDGADTEFVLVTSSSSRRWINKLEEIALDDNRLIVVVASEGGDAQLLKAGADMASGKYLFMCSLTGDMLAASPLSQFIEWLKSASDETAIRCQNREGDTGPLGVQATVFERSCCIASVKEALEKGGDNLTPSALNTFLLSRMPNSSLWQGGALLSDEGINAKLEATRDEASSLRDFELGGISQLAEAFYSDKLRLVFLEQKRLEQKLSRLEKKLNSKEKAVEKTRSEIDQIKSSKSYRVGRKLTALPRRIKKAFSR